MIKHSTTLILCLVIFSSIVSAKKPNTFRLKGNKIEHNSLLVNYYIGYPSITLYYYGACKLVLLYSTKRSSQ